MEPSFESWCQEELSKLLGVPVTQDVINYVLSFESKRDLESYLVDLLGSDNASSNRFTQELLKKWKPPKLTSNGGELYRKTDTDNSCVQLGKQQTQSSGKLTKEGEQAFKGKNQAAETYKPVPKKMVVDSRGTSFTDKTQLMEEEKKVIPRKKGSKFVPLYGADGRTKADVMQYPGRHQCQCLGQKHGLVNNCLDCGRIVCEQEGSGPCLFCGNLVCTQEEMETLARNSKKSAKLYQKLMNPSEKENLSGQCSGNSDLEKAVAHKNRLLDYDRTSTRRTKVIDDQADYFALNSSWLSKEQRSALAKRENELREKRHRSRKDKTFTLDFAGRRVIEDEPDMTMYSGEDDVVKSIFGPGSAEGERPFLPGTHQGLADPRIKAQAPVFLDTTKVPKSVTPFQDDTRSQKEALRIQDKEFQEMRDEGVCLSMHQPWASLLVKGIKRVEGRGWYTAHRGRLWIASTAQKPDPDVINMIENEYREYYKGEKIRFPKEYPSGALLGSVDVTDCVTCEEYKEKTQSNEENSSQYIFMCECPRELTIKFPVKGKHKLWKLEPHIHAAAKKGILQT